ncbi:MAG: hypothetical protein Q9220_007229 [cf. Caloplaca sp. 1 TL-2023]
MERSLVPRRPKYGTMSLAWMIVHGGGLKASLGVESIKREHLDGGQLLFANMTLHAPDGLPIVLMERFEGLTESVDCKGDDGGMSLTFTTSQAYQYALKIWSYINEDDDKQFLLIANHDDCGAADQRQLYKVSQVLEDTADRAIKMKTSVTQWSEIGGTYDLDFGKVTQQSSTRRFKPRGFWGDIVDVGKTALEAAQGNADASQSVTFDVNVGTPGQKTNIYTDEKGRFSIDCVDCYIKGSWHVEGHITVKNFVLQDLLLSAAPSNFLAKLGLEATVTSSKEPDSLQESKELFSAPIPGAGISVTGIFKLGATVSLEVGTSATFAGTATADFGLQASLPNAAKVVADINNPSGSSATGWQSSSLTPTFEVTKLSASITLAAFAQPKIAFGVELIEVGNVDVAVTMKLPEISSTLSASYDTAGVCPSSNSKTGVKLENKATESLSLQIDLDLGDDNSKPSWSKTLLEYSQPLGDACFPLNIPGLGPADSSSSSAAPKPSGTKSGRATSCSPPGKSGICQVTSLPCSGGAYIAGYCPGDDSIRCCPKDTSSTSTTHADPTPTTCKPPGKTGICQDDSITCSGGAYISGYCPGGDSIRCCPDKDSTPTTTTRASATSTTCKPPGKTGICQDDSIACSGGAYISGYCPGGNSIRCCPDPPAPSGGGGGCKMKRDRLGRRILAESIVIPNLPTGLLDWIEGLLESQATAQKTDGKAVTIVDAVWKHACHNLQIMKMEQSLKSMITDRFMGTAILQGLLNKTKKEGNPSVKFHYIEDSITSADVVILGFPAGELKMVFQTTILRDAVQGKVIISLLAGVHSHQLNDVLRHTTTDSPSHIFRVIPSIGAKINESVTLIAETAHVGHEQRRMTTWMFEQLGRVQWLPESLMNEAAAASAACNALVMVAVDAIVDASVAEGIPRAAALELAASCLHIQPLYFPPAVRLPGRILHGTARFSSSDASLSSQRLPLVPNRSDLRVIEPQALARLPTLNILRSVFLGAFFSARVLFTPGFALLKKISKSPSRILNPDRNTILRAIVKPLIYDQFCAGTDKSEVRAAIAQIKHLGFSGVTLCYGKEIGFSKSTQAQLGSKIAVAGDAEIALWRQGYLETIDMLSQGDFLGMKLTGAGASIANDLIQGHDPPVSFTEAMDAIVQRAEAQKCKIWIDAEQQNLQTTIDQWAIKFMQKYNGNGNAIVYNTLQAYLKASRHILEHQIQLAHQEGWTLAIKLVRGAYLETDIRERIFDTKVETDDSYDSIVRDLLCGNVRGIPHQDFPKMQLFLAGHNAISVAKASHLICELSEQGKLVTLPEFGQLQGMADQLGCELLQHGEDGTRLAKSSTRPLAIPRVYKCLTWGTVQECMQYLVRRAVENHGATGAVKDAIPALTKELKRRFMDTLMRRRRVSK